MLVRRVVLATAAAAGYSAVRSVSSARTAMAPVTLPPLAPLADAPLQPLPRSDDKPPVPLGSLWADKPAVVMAVRRPGCQLCRAEANKLYTIKEQLEQAGVRLVAVLHEELPEQVAEFKSEFWPGELYLDTDKALYKALGGGEVRKGSLLTFLNPFGRVWSNVKESKGVSGNFTGDGLTFGGLLVVRPKTGEVVYAFQEETFGDHAPHEEVLAAARRAAKA